MTRGKHGQAAAVRHEIQDAQQQIETYQRRVRQLTEQVAVLKADALRTDSAHAQAVKRLKAERDAGVAPQVRVLEQENTKLKERADRAERDAKDTHRKWYAAATRMREHFMGEHGKTSHEATEILLYLVGGETLTVLERATQQWADGDMEKVRRLQRVKGVRK